MRILLSSAAVASLLYSAVAHAQTPPASPQSRYDPLLREPGPGDTVKSRVRPDYDPAGIRAGAFFIYPKAILTELYRDNVFYEDSDEKSDFATEIAPSVEIRSNWDNHALNVYGALEVGRYLDYTSEDYADGRAGFDGRIDIQRDLNVSGGVDYRRLHEPRSSPDQVGAAEPVEYDVYGPQARLTKRFNRLSVQIGGSATEYDYDDAPATGGGTFDTDDRDRREIEGTARVGYEFAGRYEGFVRGTLNERSYDSTPDSSGVNRDSNGWELAGGITIDFGGITFADIYAGYLSQEYDDPGLPTIDGPSFGANVTWNVTQLTTVTFEASRTIEETTLSGAAGALSSDAQLTVDHELLRNLIVSAGARFNYIDYEGISREDDIAGLGLGATYLINRYFNAGLRYSFTARDSNVANADYETQSALLTITAQY
jgi:hypothetical protein